VLVYHTWNDLKYFTELTPTTPLFTLFGPYDPSADPFQHYAGTLDRLLSFSQLYVKARTRYLLWQHRPGVEGATPAHRSSRSYGPEALAQYRLILELLVDAARNVGASPILLSEATLISPSNGPQDRARIAYEYQGLSHEALVQAFADAGHATATVAERKQVPILDVAARLNGRSDLFADQVHFTPAGSEAIADLVAAFLATQLDARP
jgi:lysophospholipase L1-like esterase